MGTILDLLVYIWVTFNGPVACAVCQKTDADHFLTIFNFNTAIDVYGNFRSSVVLLCQKLLMIKKRFGLAKIFLQVSVHSCKIDRNGIQKYLAKS